MDNTHKPNAKKPYFLMLRGWMNTEYLKAPKEYSEREAFAYLMEEAAYKPKIREVDGMAIPIQRGQLIGSYRFLAEAWGWKKDKVKRFLNKLQRHRVIDMSSNYFVDADSSQTAKRTMYDKRPTLVTMLNYNAIQRSETVNVSLPADSDQQNNETATRQCNDKPNQCQSSAINESNNQSVWAGSADQYLFEKFPEVACSDDFINHMPIEWKNYALQEKGWHEDEVLSEAVLFWERYAGVDMADRQGRLYKLEERAKWYHVWVKWCDQEFRNIHSS